MDHRRPMLRIALILCLWAAGCAKPRCAEYDGVCNPFVSMLLYSRATAARFVAIANSKGPSISVYRMNYNTGALTPVSGSPFAAGAAMYSVSIDPTGTYLYAGSETSALIYAYTIDPTAGALTPLAGSPFASPANFPGSVRVDPSGRFLYAGINNTPNGRVAAYTISPDGSLAAVSGSPFVCGDDTIAVAVDPYTRFVFGANYFSQNVFSYSVSAATGALTPVGSYAAGLAPGHVSTDPFGRFLYVANSGDTTGSAAVSAYTIGAAGTLTAVPGSPFPGGVQPIGVSADPYGKFLFASNTTSNNVTVHSVNQTTGALTLLSIIPSAGGPFGAAFIPGLQF